MSNAEKASKGQYFMICVLIILFIIMLYYYLDSERSCKERINRSYCSAAYNCSEPNDKGMEECSVCLDFREDDNGKIICDNERKIE